MGDRHNGDKWKRSDSRIHQSTKDTRDRAYERLRETGVPHDTARGIAEDTARQAHEKLDQK